MTEQLQTHADELFDDLDDLFDDFDGVAVEGGIDSINDEGCEGGACKL